MSGYLTTGINGVVRMPVIFAGLNATLMLGETAMRVLTAGLGVIGFNGKNKYVGSFLNKIPAMPTNVMRPFEKVGNKELAIAALASAVVATLGWEICNKVIGNTPEIYNNFSNWVGPIKLDAKWRHPLVNAATTYWSGSKRD
jgi:hypothetical protein